ncbi:MAG: PTPA-CTERM sorting domain-containing protein [Synechococcales cyanobacterium CRU_2_2]|nr:PTPA-CTERM sorting domain-containing protein [Synechococcales cyanobacterium CRU_2_2]
MLDTDGINTTDLPDMRRAFANFTTPIQVSGNTPYWISMSGTRFPLGIVRSQAGTGTIPANAYIASFNDSGVNVSHVQDMPFLLYGQAATPATVVPTPAVLPGLIGFGGALWRKRKARALASQSV